MTSGWQGAPYFRRYGLELVSNPAILLKSSWGGYRKTTLRCYFDYFHWLIPTIRPFLLSSENCYQVLITVALLAVANGLLARVGR